MSTSLDQLKATGTVCHPTIAPPIMIATKREERASLLRSSQESIELRSIFSQSFGRLLLPSFHSSAFMMADHLLLHGNRLLCLTLVITALP